MESDPAAVGLHRPAPGRSGRERRPRDGRLVPSAELGALVEHIQRGETLVRLHDETGRRRLERVIHWRRRRLCTAQAIRPTWRTGTVRSTRSTAFGTGAVQFLGRAGHVRHQRRRGPAERYPPRDAGRRGDDPQLFGGRPDRSPNDRRPLAVAGGLRLLRRGQRAVLARRSGPLAWSPSCWPPRFPSSPPCGKVSSSRSASPGGLSTWATRFTAFKMQRARPIVPRSKDEAQAGNSGRIPASDWRKLAPDYENWPVADITARDPGSNRPAQARVFDSEDDRFRWCLDASIGGPGRPAIRCRLTFENWQQHPGPGFRRRTAGGRS